MTLFWKTRKKILKCFAKNIPVNTLRIFLYKNCGYIIGEQVYVAEGLTIAEYLEDTKNLVIGDRVAIGPNVVLLTSSNPNFSRIRPYVKNERGKIVIEDDAWIGAGAIIMPNVKLGEGAVVGAGSVVTKDVESYTIVAGVPGRVIKKIEVKK